MAEELTLTGDGTFGPIKVVATQRGNDGDKFVTPGVVTIHLYSTAWQGATVKAQLAPLGGGSTKAADITDASYTANKPDNLQVAEGELWFNVSGSGSPEPVITVTVSDGLG